MTHTDDLRSSPPVGTISQVCSRCAQTLPLSAYAESNRGKGGAYCRTCHASYMRERRARLASTQKCSGCREVLPHEEFSASVIARGSGYCRDCHREYVRSHGRKAKPREVAPPGHLRCPGCEVVKPIEAWSPAARQQGRRCRECLAERHRERSARAVEAASKRCSGCKETLPVEQFTPGVRSVAGARCRECAAAYSAARWRKDAGARNRKRAQDRERYAAARMAEGHHMPKRYGPRSTDVRSVEVAVEVAGILAARDAARAARRGDL